MDRLWEVRQRFGDVTDTYPLIFMSLQTGVLMGLGDVAAQTMLPATELHDFQLSRFFTFTCIGLFVVGPAVANWYHFLEYHMGDQERTPLLAVKKMVLDQLLFAPTFLAIVMTLVALSEGKSFEEIRSNLRNNYLGILASNYKVWPLFQYVNFRLVPFRYQVVASQLMAILWNTYLSWRLFPEVDAGLKHNQH